jgi:hypothetical protein
MSWLLPTNLPIDLSTSSLNLFYHRSNIVNFADDIGVLASSLSSLQATVDILMDYNHIAELCTQAKKSVIIVFHNKSRCHGHSPSALKITTPTGDVFQSHPSTVHCLLAAYFSVHSGISDSLSYSISNLCDTSIPSSYKQIAHTHL